MTVGERIKERRKEINMSADELAVVLRVSRSTVFRYENGSIEKLPVHILDTIAKALHTTPEYLMGWADKPDETNQDEASASEKNPTDMSLNTQKEPSDSSTAAAMSSAAAERKVSDDELKLALFGGDSEVTDEMWEEALMAAEIIRERHRRKKEKRD